MPAEHGATINGVVRQSTLKTMDACPQAAQWEAMGFKDWSSGPAALGTAFHLAMEEMFRTLQRQGEQQIPTEEAVTVMTEVISSAECPHLSVRQMRDLRMMVLNFCDHIWTVKRGRFEERLECEVPCPDGKMRKITGKPDALLVNGPDSILILDAKTGWSVPPAPRGWDGVGVPEGEQYLSERGIFQGNTLGLLVMRNFDKVHSTLFREFYPRLNQMRESLLTRDNLEHVEKRLGVLAQRWDMMVNGELEPEPRPGTHCSYCPRPTECPIWPEERREGALAEGEDAAEWAGHLAVVEGLRKRLIDGLKPYLDANDLQYIDIDGAVVGWDREGTGRKFGVHKAAEA